MMPLNKIEKMKNACAPVALCHASGRDEDTVLRVCISRNFTQRDGMSNEEWGRAADDLGIVRRKIAMKPMRLKTFLKKYPTGLYLVTTHDHIFCVDGGVIFDPRARLKNEFPGLYRIITDAWKVETA